MRDGFKVLDAHMHYSGTFLTRRASILDYMDENGIDEAIVNTLNTKANMTLLERQASTGLEGPFDGQHIELFKDFREGGQPDHEVVERLMAAHGNRVHGFFWYNPTACKSAAEGVKIVENALRRGYKGIKLHLAMIPVSLDEMDPLAETLEEERVPLYIHPSSGLFGAPRTRPAEIGRLAKRFPHLPIIIGHAASTMEFCIEAVVACRDVENVYFETSVSIPFGIVSLVKLCGPSRVIFGSDSPTSGPFSIEYEKIAILDIPARVKQQVLHENMARLLDT